MGAAGITSLLRLVRPSGNDPSRKVADTVPEFAESLGCQIAESIPFRSGIAESSLFHFLGGSAESLRTHFVHLNEAEGLGRRQPIRSRMHELDLRRHFAKHGSHIHFRQRSLWNGIVGKNSGTSGKGETPKHSNKFLGIHGE
jgi:hypothetical protein